MSGSFWNRNAIPNFTSFEDMIYAVKLKSQVKADNPYTTSTASLNNTIYGLYIWNQINYDELPYSTIPNSVYRKSGFRTKTAKAVLTTVNGNTKYGGMSETGKFPELTKPTYDDIEIDPKIMGIAYGETLKQELLARTEDDTWGGMSNIKLDIAQDYKEFFAESIMRDQETEAAAATGHYAYKSAYDLTNYDRGISNNAEENALGGTYNGQYDIYTDMDRDSSSTYDSTVLTCNESKIIGGSNGVLDRNHFLDLVQNIRTNSPAKSDPTHFLMSHEVAAQVHMLYAGQINYTVNDVVSTGVDGMNNSGYGVQLDVAAIDKIPIISTKWSCKRASDTTQLGKIFALNNRSVGSEGYCNELRVLLPTTDTSVMWGLIHNDLTTRAGFVTIVEWVLNQPKTCGKITDIAAR